MKKKILILLNTLSLGGSQTYALTVAKGLIRRGHEVHIAAKPGPLSVVAAGLGVKTHAMRVDSGLRKPADSLTRYAARFALLYVRSAVSLFILCRRERFDVLVSQQPAPTFLALVMSRISGAPVLYIVHHVLPNEFPPLFYRFFRYRLPSIVAISHEIRDHLLNVWGLGKEKVSVIINCIDLEEYDNSVNRVNDMPGPKRVVYVSAISDAKKNAVVNFIHAAEIASRQTDDISFEIVGDGNIFEEIQRLVRETNESAGYEIIKLLGGRTDIIAVLKGASVCIGIARCAREAMALGIPTILVGHLTGKKGGNYGGIIDRRNIEELEYSNLSGRSSSILATPEIIAADIMKLISDPGYAEEVSRFGLQYVRNNCCSELICQKLENELDKLIGQ